MFEEVNSAHLGQCLWCAYPDSRPLFEPIYERAWTTGHTYVTVFYRGDLLELHANVRDARLFVTCRVLTIDGLEEALRLIAAHWRLAGSSGSPPPGSRSALAEPHLRVV